jgi:hypothetical protein
MVCNHAHITNICSKSTCTCWCDTCQEAFEADWDHGVVAKGLCPKCGFPLEGESLTLEKVQETKLYHFFMPCEDCKGHYEAFMKKEGLCSRCQGPAPCEKCRCKKEENPATPCTCYDCRTAAYPIVDAPPEEAEEA